MTFKCNPYYVLPSMATLPRGLVQLVEQLNNDFNFRGLNPGDAVPGTNGKKYCVSRNGQFYQRILYNHWSMI